MQKHLASRRARRKVRTMSSTHLSLHFQVVFSTKDREAYFAPSTRPRVHEYMAGIVAAEGGVRPCRWRHR
jgi:hypothetical protein